jgi:hypothetical protein
LLGRPITVHSTRHAMATARLTADPTDIAMASAGLAHRGTTSVNRVYDKSGGDTANAIWTGVRQKAARRAATAKSPSAAGSYVAEPEQAGCGLTQGG